MSEKTLDDWGSHQRTLIRAALRTPGDILEMGMGWYSTPLLQEIAAARGDRLFCYESDAAWLANVSRIIHKDVVSVKLVEWASFEIDPTWDLGLAFVDEYGPCSDRWPYMEALSKVAKTVVVHDAHSPPFDLLRALFKHVQVIKVPGPPTVIASNLPGVVFDD